MGYTKHVLHAVPRELLLVLLACILLLTGCGAEQSGTEPPKYSELRERYVPYVDNLLIIHSGESPTEEFQQARRLVLAAEELEAVAGGGIMLQQDDNRLVIYNGIKQYGYRVELG